MKEKVSVVLVGIAGYGNVYLTKLLDTHFESAYVKAVVDIRPEHSNFYEEIKSQNIPIYESLEAFYEIDSADLAIIVTPIHLHKQQSCYAMNHGSHVLCEKPATANPTDLEEMIKTRNQTGKFLAIGFNWSFTPSVQQLKQDILADKFGKPKRLKSLVLWPRNEDYFLRSAWAGKKFSPDGQMIFDSVANNATAHFLHHLLYVLGDTIETSARLQTVTAELYHVNPIETFDTCAVNIKTVNGVEIVYLASHAIEKEHNPKFMLEFEHATITYNPENGTKDIVAQYSDGSKKVYANPENDHLAKLTTCINAILDDNQDILCGPEAASSHVTSIHAMHQSVPTIPSFPDSTITYHKDKKLLTVNGLEEILQQCYTDWCLPKDLGATWSRVGKKVALA